MACIEPPVPVVIVEASQLKERVLVIGDVHGCLDELKALLDQSNYADGRTTVVLVGDICNKGPFNAETVSFCRLNKFLCVRGNHDHAALKVSCAQPFSRLIQCYNCVYQAYYRMAPKYSNELPDSWKWVAKLSKADVDWLQQLPYALVCPFGVVVHAGLHPGVLSIHQQDPLAMMHVRNIRTSDGHWLEDDGNDAQDVAAWAPMWSGPQRVFFGHDAKRRLQRCKWALGLDTACVYGFQLTAAEVAGGTGAHLAFDEVGAEVKLISVNAMARYCASKSS